MQVVRYLATVAPLGKTDPAVWSSAFNDGSFETEERGGWKELRELNQGREREYASARGWARSRADGAAHGVELGSDQQYLGNRRDAKGEREWAERLALEISDTASLEHDPQSVYEAVPGKVAAALGSGLSLEAALEGLSLGAVRLYLRSDIVSRHDIASLPSGLRSAQGCQRYRC